MTIFKVKNNRVTQSDIAKAVKLNRTTVTKILNNDPTYFPNDRTRKKVIQKAIRMGYKLNAHKDPDKIDAYENLKVDIECGLTFAHADGSISTGVGRAINLSPDGVVVESVSLSNDSLPLDSKTTMHFSLPGLDRPLECHLTFIQYPQTKDDWTRGVGVKVGIEFENIVKDTRSNIAYIMKHPHMN